MNHTVKFYAILVAMIVTCLGFSPEVNADTTLVSGTVDTNTVWTPAGNPYLVIGDTRVDTNVTLTIQPGCTVKFNLHLGLTVDGALDARGTESDSIIFTSNAGSFPGKWRRIEFSNSSVDTACILEYCRIEYGGGFEADERYGVVYCLDASPTIRSCTIQKNKSYKYAGGISIAGSSAPVISKNTISENSSGKKYNDPFVTKGGGIYIAGGTPIITENIITGNSTAASQWAAAHGGGIFYEASRPIISHNTIDSNVAGSGAGIAALSGGVISCNLIRGNVSTHTDASLAKGGGIKVYSNVGCLLIVGNTIIDNHASGPPVNAAGIWFGGTNNDDVLLNHNNIYGNSDLVNSVFEVYAGAGSVPINAEYNWWGTTDPGSIALLVYDFDDDPSLRELDYTPFATDSTWAPSDSMEVISPNGGEEWLIDDTNKILWNPFCFTDNVNIEYSTDGGSTWDTIINGTVNVGMYSWEIPFVISTNCRVRVSDATDGFPTDMSNSDFTICAGPTILVAYPNGGEVLSADSTYDIMWNSYCFDSSVKIEYSTNGGADWTTIVDDTANIGFIAWTIPHATSPNCRVKVSDAQDGDPFDISDDDFSVYICGDADGSGAVNVADLTYLVDYIFFGGPAPPVFEAANVDGEGGINVADLIYLVDYIFFEGPEPICGPIE